MARIPPPLPIPGESNEDYQKRFRAYLEGQMTFFRTASIIMAVIYILLLLSLIVVIIH